MSKEIEHWVEIEYRDAIAGYVRRYGPVFERKLGLTRDDLVNDIREQVWKGLVTYDPTRKANKRTYLNNILKNRMGVLLKRCSIKKNNSVDYVADLWSTAGIDREYIETDETPESIFAQRELLIKVNFFLTPFDRLVNADLLEGRGLEEMETIHRVTRSVIIGAVKRIDALKRHLTGEP